MALAVLRLLFLHAVAINSFGFTAKPLQRSRCLAKGLAKYNVTFYARWSRRQFPKQYPLYRPHAQWSKLLGRSHNDNFNMFHEGSVASPGLKQFAEKGRSGLLDQQAQGSNGILDAFGAPPIRRGEGTTSVTFLVDLYHSKVSLIAHIVPSPDWFVGVDSIDLCGGHGWIDETLVDLDPYDAGTDQGFTFSSPNWKSVPPAKIKKITSRDPNHPASSFFYPERDHHPHIGTFVFKRVQTYSPDESNFVSTDHTKLESKVPVDEVKYRTVHCEVSPWIKWGPCSKSCGYGHKIRTRTITQNASGQGNVCPNLHQTKTCGSMRTCKWKHFSFSHWGQKSELKTSQKS